MRFPPMRRQLNQSIRRFGHLHFSGPSATSRGPPRWAGSGEERINRPENPCPPDWPRARTEARRCTPGRRAKPSWRCQCLLFPDFFDSTLALCLSRSPSRTCRNFLICCRARFCRGASHTRCYLSQTNIAGPPRPGLRKLSGGSIRSLNIGDCRVCCALCTFMRFSRRNNGSRQSAMCYNSRYDRRKFIFNILFNGH